MTLTAANPPSVTEVARICAIDNRVIRNLQITECYAQLSAAMVERNGHPEANWCTFATWASRQAGRTIRGEDLLDTLKRRLGGQTRALRPFRSIGRVLLRKGLFEPQTRLGAAVAAIHTPFDSLERASEAVARGNLKVFQEIGAEFARFLASVPAAAADDSIELRQFVDALRSGAPPEGQDGLKEAFRNYQTARRMSDPSARAARMLLANAQIGLHEQTRLQPQITEAVDAPAVTATDLGRRALHALWPPSRRWPSFVHGPLAAVIGPVAKGVRQAGLRLTREVVTESMMTLALPGVTLALGRDLDVRVPEVLSAARDTGLDAFVAEYDPCPPGGVACGATDWCDLRQRMHYILHLFRAYACHAALFTAPFTPQQVGRFQAGQIPGGRL